jgi:hypothetical protein
MPRRTFNLRSLFAFLSVCAAVFALVRWSGPAWPHLTGIVLAVGALVWFWRSSTGYRLRRSRKGIALFLLASLVISCPCYMAGELVLWVAEELGLLPAIY